jgi:hypothetical protein
MRKGNIQMGQRRIEGGREDGVGTSGGRKEASERDIGGGTYVDERWAYYEGGGGGYDEEVEGT